LPFNCMTGRGWTLASSRNCRARCFKTRRLGGIARLLNSLHFPFLRFSIDNPSFHDSVCFPITRPVFGDWRQRRGFPYVENRKSKYFAKFGDSRFLCCFGSSYQSADHMIPVNHFVAAPSRKGKHTSRHRFSVERFVFRARHQKTLIKGATGGYYDDR
jgi:hypothetical protein